MACNKVIKGHPLIRRLVVGMVLVVLGVALMVLKVVLMVVLRDTMFVLFTVFLFKIPSWMTSQGKEPPHL